MRSLGNHFAYLLTLAKSKSLKKVRISTYGVYAGIYVRDGKPNTFRNKAHELLSILHDRKIDTSILVGVKEAFNCIKEEVCEHCAEQYLNQIERYQAHADNWPNFKWRWSNHLHMKCYVFTGNKTYGVAGGRNLNDSDYADISFVLTEAQCEEATEAFDDLFKKARKDVMVFLDKDTI